MDFGIFDHLDSHDRPLSAIYSDRLEFIRSAEAGNFRAYHLAEHHGTPLGMAPSPNLFLSAVARSTTSIRMGAMVYCLPLYIPLRLLEEICMLDNLSNGRLDVGVGRGASPFESAFYAIDAGESVERYTESLEILKLGLKNRELTYSGKYFTYTDVPMELTPVQNSIPFWAAPASPEGQEYAARAGMHIMSLGSNERVRELASGYKSIWPRHNDKDSIPLIGAYRLVFVTEDESKIESCARPAFEKWFGNLCKLWRENNATTPFMKIRNFDNARDIGMVIAGVPDRVAEILAYQLAECGYNYPVLQFMFGNLGHVNEMKSLHLFCEKVMPQLNK